MVKWRRGGRGGESLRGVAERRMVDGEGERRRREGQGVED